MSNFLEYKGYYTHIHYSAEDGCNYGRIEDIDACISFDDADGRGIVVAFQEAVDFHIEACRAEGREPQRPCSGRFNTRIPSDLHRRLVLKAAREGKSQNAIVEEAIAAYV
ncbi:MAG: type II toxin-antitoxin system HicB family antitoxin [Slackia sp.]|nr:type II toxin-antitoxin system HicB family antitoxin [Slackia sp.]